VDVRRLALAGVRSPAFVPVALLLVAPRFAAPTLIAFLGVRGMDTGGLDAFFTAYSAVLPVVLVAFLGDTILTWPGGVRARSLLALAGTLLVLSLAIVLLVVEPSTRLVAVPWGALVLGLVGAGSVVAFGLGLQRDLDAAVPLGSAADGFRALWVGFGAAYGIESLRLVDYGYLVGWSPPSGLVWLWDYGPTMLLSLLAIYFWLDLSFLRSRSTADRGISLAVPLAGAVLGLAASQGLGGFILSNALTWGGSYAIFSPTSVSLSIVGFAVGGVVAVAWALRGRLAWGPWRLVVGGIFIAALSGIRPFGGTVASVSGILLGLAATGRGIAELFAASEYRQ